ncbi:hypothetical protein BH23GEM3_BH23GEM3_20970 [soil metagenome]
MTRINTELVAISRSTHPDANQRFENDTEFHRCYVEAGAGLRLKALYEAVKPQAERYIRLYITLLTGEVRTSAGEHEAIIAAIASGNPDCAQRAVQTNWRNAAERLARVIDTTGERGSW